MYVDFETVLDNLRHLSPLPRLQYCIQTEQLSDVYYTMVCIWLNCYSAILCLVTHTLNSTEYTICEVDVSHEDKEAYILRTYFEHIDNDTSAVDTRQHMQNITRNINSFCVRVLWGNNWMLHANERVATFGDGHRLAEWFRDRSNWIWMRA